MSALSKAVPQELRTFVEPQVEQLALRMEPAGCGVYGTVPAGIGEGFLWTAALGDDCLASVHAIRLNRPFVLEERPSEFACVFSGSRATVISVPELHVQDPSERENLAAFSQEGKTTRCLLVPGCLYESTSVTYTPDFFDRIKGLCSDDLTGVRPPFAPDTARLPSELRDILRSFGPRRAALPGAALYFRAKALEAVSALSACLVDDTGNSRRHGAAADRLLVERARRIIGERCSEHLSVQSIADELYVSRSRLCDAFRKELGTGVAACLRAERMKRARRLLSDGDAGIDEVARACGYARASSFDEAFRRECGCSPSEWRACSARRLQMPEGGC